MSIKTTLKKAFGIQSDIRDYASEQDKYVCSSEEALKERSREKEIRQWTIEEGERLKEEMDKERGHVSLEVQGTPLFIRGDRDGGYYLVLGNYKVTGKISDLEVAKGIADQTDWKTIMNVIAVMVETAFRIQNKELGKEEQKPDVG